MRADGAGAKLKYGYIAITFSETPIYGVACALGRG